MAYFKKLLDDHNISAYRLQKDLGLSKQTLYNYTSGKRDFLAMDVLLAHKIANYLGISLDKLCTDALEYQKLTNKRPN